MAKIQFLPALPVLNKTIIIALATMTMVFGKVYCSVLCPLGMLRVIFGWFGETRIIIYVDVRKRKLISLLTNDMTSDTEEMRQNFPQKCLYGEST